MEDGADEHVARSSNVAKSPGVRAQDRLGAGSVK